MNSNLKLTVRQREILEFIRESLITQGRPPTRAEVCTAFGFKSPNAAESHLRALAAKGAIILEEGRARGIRLPPSMSTDPGLPIVGKVAAGVPIMAIEHIESHHRIDPALFDAKPDFLLRVSGMSMRDAGILDGDLLAVKQTHEARNGQVVVVRVNDEVTVKTFSRQGARVCLLPANPEFSPIEVDLRTTELNIEGRVVGLLRKNVPH
ncbi:MAG: transcriptional repressor LexA [Rhodocyclaceae bacterium]